ncbi:MAG: sulfatase [Deltaproteobacteria bacterium]|nr:sulfatase [Deltaproteobacteria bacterium]
MLLALLACSLFRQEVQVTSVRDYPEPYRSTGGDVVIVVLDTLRADHLSQYGYPLDTSPALASFAATATLYTQAWAPSPWTVPSTAAILTGLHPLRHQLRHPGDVLPEAIDTLPEQFRRAGWRTAAYSHNVSVAPKHALDQGFDQFTRNTGKVLGYPHAGRMTRAAKAWIAEQPGPFFLYLQPMNCHGPYKVPSERRDDVLGRSPSTAFEYYGPVMRKILKEGKLSAREKITDRHLRSLQEQYDTAIRYTTGEVAELFDALRAAGRYDAATIVLTADHGEEMFEHGGFSHGYSLHREVLSVPLMVKLPGQSEGRQEHAPVSLVDIAPTVLAANGIDVPPLDGLPLGQVGERSLVFDINWPRRIVGQALLEGGFKLLSIKQDYTGRENATLLYDTLLDPGETQDLAATMPEKVTAMSSRLSVLASGLVGHIEPHNVLSEMDQAQLEALGYLEE